LDYENSRDPVIERREFVARMAQCCERSVEPDNAIRILARTLAQTYQIRGRDALHLASAEFSGCDYLVTCDDRLVGQALRLREQGRLKLRVLSPLDLLREV